LRTGNRPSRIFLGLPPHGSRQRIGLFGGSFNPPHEGHRRASLLALRRLDLDAVWWMVTPGNPLKANGGLPPLEERMAAAAGIASHPRIFISGAETGYRTRYTADLIAILKTRHPTTRFVWIMGSDGLVDFHRWESWRTIASSVPIAVVNRPKTLLAPLFSRAAQALSRYRVDPDDARVLAGRPPPAWIFLTGPRASTSSTALRERVLKR
jgi:nicotinate-nucleotide adenylyltransferase